MKKIDLKMMRLMLLSGANNLYNFHYEVDKLNVFPVPDGDTGTNMNLTMMNGVKLTKNESFNSLKEFCNKFSRGLIMGARGNSGVILSQIFRGFFYPIVSCKEEKNFLDCEIILDSMLKAKEFAYKAILKPVEGTILTVINDSATFTVDNLSKELNVNIMFEKIVETMEQSLKNTPNLLPILKKVGVVDSGGAGLLYIFKGMLYALKHNKAIPVAKKISTNDQFNFAIEQKEFGYCTEAIVKKIKEDNKFVLEQAQSKLEELKAQSIVLVEVDDLIKMHAHTLNPLEILHFIETFGEFVNVKVENMSEQAKSHSNSFTKKRSLVNEYALITCVNGSGIKDYFENELKVNHAIDYSNKNNPSTNDFLEVIERVDAKVVYILPNDSNLLLAAQQAKKLEKESKVYILPTTNIAQGMRAALSFSSGLSHKENFKEMNSEIKNTAFGYISIADRGNIEIDEVKIQKNDFLAAKTLRKEKKSKISCANSDFSKVVEKLFADIIWSSAEIVTIFKGKQSSKEHEEVIINFLEEKYGIEYEIIQGEQEVYNFFFVVE